MSASRTFFIYVGGVLLLAALGILPAVGSLEWWWVAILGWNLLVGGISDWRGEPKEASL